MARAAKAIFSKVRGRQQNALLAQMFDHRGNDRIAAIRTGRLFDRDMNNGALVFASERTDAEIGLKFAEMLSTRLLRGI